MSDQDSFKNESLPTKIFIIVSVSLIILAAIGFVVALIFFGFVGLFRIIGIEYSSYWSLLWFAVFYFICGFIGDFIVKLLFGLMRASGRWSWNALKGGYFFLSFLINWGIISILVALMSSIDIQPLTQIGIALFLALLDLVFDPPKEKKADMEEGGE